MHLRKFCRLIGPAFDYIQTFQTALLRLRLAVAGGKLVTEDARASFQAVTPQLLIQANAAGAVPPKLPRGSACCSAALLDSPPSLFSRSGCQGFDCV